jgi:hypothetical protein
LSVFLLAVERERRSDERRDGPKARSECDTTSNSAVQNKVALTIESSERCGGVSLDLFEDRIRIGKQLFKS